MEYDVRVISTLEKVLPKGGMLNARPLRRLTGFRGQRVAFQAAYCFHGDYYVNQTTEQATRNPFARVRVEGDFEGEVRLRRVECVPVTFPCEKKHDSEYIGEQAGLYPDLLTPLKEGVQLVWEQWRALWVDCEIPQNAPGGDRRVELVFTAPGGAELARAGLTLHVVPAALPPQRLLHTEWFYPDCLAQQYGCEVFSERHWTIMEHFLRLAAKRGINMILTPLFTPALDTLIGAERPTTQLVGVEKRGGEYRFDYTRFRRWIRLCKAVGFEYFEMAHLFAQWGAKYPPKVVAQVESREEAIFGWHTPVSEGGYKHFLDAFLPTLLDELRAEGILERTYFHVSDEPTIYNADTYQAALDMVLPHLKGLPIIDALSHVELYEKGIVKKPVPTNDSIHEFLDAGLTDAWVYYCCAQGDKVSNRYIAMPAWRSRVLGVQLYKYRMEGFLHWGYNFWNCQYSLHPIDPYRVNDAEDSFPAGDPFLVYPGRDGEPEESIRLPVLADAMDDVRLLEWLEQLTSREFVMQLGEEGGRFELRFDQYPSGPDYLLELWEAAAAEVERRL